MAEKLAHLYKRTSEMAQAVLDELELDQDIRAKLHFSNASSFPAIHRAIRNGHMKAAQILSNAPAAMGMSDLIGRTTWHIAAETGRAQFLGVPTLDGIDHPDLFDRTPLFLASCNGNMDSLAYLVERGSDIEARTSSGWSVLAAACYAGHVEIVQYLLERGANPNDNLSGTSTPLYAAASKGHYEIYKLLVEKGAFEDYFVKSHFSIVNGTTDNTLMEISETERRATDDQTMRCFGTLPTSKGGIESLFDLAPATPSSTCRFSEPSMGFSNGDEVNHELNSCDPRDPGFDIGLSCTEHDLHDLVISDKTFPQWLGGNMDVGTIQNPWEVGE